MDLPSKTEMPGELSREIERLFLAAVMEADAAFEKADATGTKTWVREFLLNRLEAHGLGIGMKDRLPPETTADRTDHAENLAKALEHYLNAHDTLSVIRDADDVTGQCDAVDGGFVEKANDAWRALRTALHEYRKIAR